MTSLSKIITDWKNTNDKTALSDKQALAEITKRNAECYNGIYSNRGKDKTV